MNYERVILNLLNHHSSIRGEYLALRVMEEVNVQKFSNEEFSNALCNLIESKKVIQLMYTTENTTKIIYFPGGTTFNIGA